MQLKLYTDCPEQLFKVQGPVQFCKFSIRFRLAQRRNFLNFCYNFFAVEYDDMNKQSGSNKIVGKSKQVNPANGFDISVL